MWGTLRNVRRRYDLATGCTVEVDETYFPDGAVDWEVELEAEDPEATRVHLQRFLDSENIRWCPQAQSKSQRLLRHLTPPSGGISRNGGPRGEDA